MILIDKSKIHSKFDLLLVGTQVVRRCDLDVKPHRTNPKAEWQKKTCPVPYEELRRLYQDEKMTQTEIAEKFGVGHCVVRRWCREGGIPPRTRKERIALCHEKGQKRSRQYWWRLTSPDGQIYEGIFLTKLCRQLGLNYKAIQPFAKKGRPHPTGWRVEREVIDDCMDTRKPHNS